MNGPFVSVLLVNPSPRRDEISQASYLRKQAERSDDDDDDSRLPRDMVARFKTGKIFEAVASLVLVRHSGYRD
jgi:hypothetical protein